MKSTLTQLTGPGTPRCLGNRVRSFMWAFALLVIGTSGSLQASHFAGAEFKIDWLSGDTYRITKNVYRDCRGISLASTMSTTLFRNNVNVGGLGLPRISITDITPLCPGQVSSCPSGSTFGLEEHIYRANTPALVANSDYRIQISNSARNGAITTGAANQLMFIYANFRTGINNSSPRFLNRPVGTFCANQPATFSPNGFDPDGDAILYSLQTCYQGFNQSVTYNPGFNPVNPLNSSTPIVLNPNTGALTFTPSVAGQVAIICLRADEYRNGTLIGSIVRDMQINILNCSNAAPVIAPVANVVVNVGQNYCTPITATDINNNNITLSAVSGIIPPATFVVNSTSPGNAAGTFCFTPNLSHVGNTYTVTINAVDNACPSPATGVMTFNITVPLPCNMTATASGTPTSCGGNTGTATVNVTNGTAPITYSWTGPSGYTSFNASNSGLAAGTYNVLVVDGNSCVANATVVVGSNGSSLVASGTTTPANCGQTNGTLTVSVTGGTAPYLYSVDGGAFGSSATFSGLAVGTHTFDVTDANGCPATGSALVGEARDLTPPVIHCQANMSVATNPGACCGTATFAAATATDNCGSATVSQTGGSASGTCLAVGSHVVTFTAADAYGNTSSCSFTIVVTDNEAPSITCPANVTVNCVADIPASDLGSVSVGDNCGGIGVTVSETSTGSGCNGSAMVVSRTYTVEDQYHNSSSCTQLLTAEATPLVATCSGTAFVIPAWQDSSCTTISASAAGGCGPYRYTWCNGGQSSSISVCPTASTTYTVTVTDAQGCTATCSVTVCAIDITCSGGTNNGQGGTGQGGNGTSNSLNAMQHIAICHFPPGNANNGMTKCLPIPAATQHFTIGHGGDYLGACGSLTSRNCTATTVCGANKNGGSDMVQAGGSSINVNVFPSPTSGLVNVDVACYNCGDEGSYSLKVTDVYGKQLLATDVNVAMGAGKAKIDLSRFAAGVYMIVVENGDQRIVERIVKQ
ncbi:MAG: HYR domain-containing protein [Bacteroidetes bacterium]|nr:HYR domain-containing protein [Bacteroidota bacterium]